LDSTQLEASLAATKANVSSLEAQVNEANHNYTWTNNQTDASVTEARARVVSSSAQLAPAHAQLWRDQQDLKRMQELFAKGEAREEAVRAESAAVEVAQANRKQVDARKSAITTTMAQLEQARASAAE